MNVFVTGVSTIALWAGLSAAVFAATPSAIELHPSMAVPGATLSIGGKGFGAFRSVQVNRVTVGGFPALIQRWESDLIEVKVPFRAQSGPVEIMAGKKKLSAGKLIILQPTITLGDAGRDRTRPYGPDYRHTFRSHGWSRAIPIRCSESTMS